MSNPIVSWHWSQFPARLATDRQIPLLSILGFRKTLELGLWDNNYVWIRVTPWPRSNRKGMQCVWHHDPDLARGGCSVVGNMNKRYIYIYIYMIYVVENVCVACLYGSSVVVVGDEIVVMVCWWGGSGSVFDVAWIMIISFFIYHLSNLYKKAWLSSIWVVCCCRLCCFSIRI